VSARGRGRASLAVVLAVVGGLATAGGAAAPWRRVEEQREIGGVLVPEVETIGGLAVVPALLPLGLAAAIAGLLLLVVRGRLQTVVAILLLGAGVTAGVLLALGIARSPRAGDLGAGVAFAALGALLLGASGVLGARPAAPATLPARYDLDRDDADDEWRLASGDEAGPGDDPHG
jgi:hypothetical protein